MAEHPVHTAVEQLAAATTPGELRKAHRQSSAAVKLARRKAAAKLGPLARAYTEAMELWDELKAKGASLDDRLAGLENVLRQVWPQTREWHYLCESCRDVGLVLKACAGEGLCGRSKPHPPHEFGVPCHCPKGRAFQAKPKPTGDDFAQAGKAKRGGFTKAGR